MAKTVRILGVHGLGHQELNWFEDWKKVVRAIYADADDLQLEFQACNYDQIFQNVKLHQVNIFSALSPATLKPA